MLCDENGWSDKFLAPNYLFKRYVFDWNHVERIKTNARVYVELYWGHVNIGNGICLYLWIRTSGKTCIVQ